MKEMKWEKMGLVIKKVHEEQDWSEIEKGWMVKEMNDVMVWVFFGGKSRGSGWKVCFEGKKAC
uniref:hypothetical protein n=1 Tax=Bacillus altitudinis TaxID=293387 RepID=UPI0016437C7C